MKKFFWRTWWIATCPWQLVRRLEQIERHLSRLADCVGGTHPYENLPSRCLAVKTIWSHYQEERNR